MHPLNGSEHREAELRETQTYWEKVPQLGVIFHCNFSLAKGNQRKSKRPMKIILH
jgi:hypothetical protein